ncbi:hypothetical protein [Hydrogenivirga sp.]
MRGKTHPPKKLEVHLYRNSWITGRSENLTKLYDKNREVSEYRV